MRPNHIIFGVVENDRYVHIGYATAYANNGLTLGQNKFPSGTFMLLEEHDYLPTEPNLDARLALYKRHVHELHLPDCHSISLQPLHIPLPLAYWEAASDETDSPRRTKRKLAHTIAIHRVHDKNGFVEFIEVYKLGKVVLTPVLVNP